MGLTRWYVDHLPFFPILTITLGGTWGAGFKPSWYMTGSDVGDDPHRLVRASVLVSRTLVMAHADSWSGHIRIRIRHATDDCYIYGSTFPCHFTGRFHTFGSTRSRDVSKIEPAGGRKVRLLLLLSESVGLTGWKASRRAQRMVT